MRKGLTIVEIIVILCIVGLLIFIFYPVVFPRRVSRSASQAFACLSNQKHLATIIYMYAQDNNETMPIVDKNIFITIGGSPDAPGLTCPKAKKLPHGGYIVNGALSGIDINKVDDPSSVWLTADGKKDSIPVGRTEADMDPRHHGVIIFSRFDGSVDMKKLDE